jgi:hypothetical protein
VDLDRLLAAVALVLPRFALLMGHGSSSRPATLHASKARK